MARKTPNTIGTRLNDAELSMVKAKAEDQGLTVSQYVRTLVQRDIHGQDTYLLQSAARSSHGAFVAVLTLIQLLYKEGPQAVTFSNGLSKELDTLFGKALGIPPYISEHTSCTTDAFVSELLSLYRKHNAQLK